MFKDSDTGIKVFIPKWTYQTLVNSNTKAFSFVSIRADPGQKTLPLHGTGAGSVNTGNNCSQKSYHWNKLNTFKTYPWAFRMAVASASSRESPGHTAAPAERSEPRDRKWARRSRRKKPHRIGLNFAT
jgi:hypothetical protein